MKNKIHLTLLAIAALLGSAVIASAHGAEFKPAFVDSLVPDYLAVQTALAGDDLAAAQKAASNLLTTAKHGPEFTAFTTPASELAKAKNIKAARAQFQTVSMEMQDLVDHVGTTNKVKLYEAHCPMAFGGKGGDWLQGDQKISNPYYGAMMLRCGSIKGQVAGEKSSMPAHGKHGHGDH
jgi:Cu(I)/Ag(I) efflux system membrane fusion protein